MPSCLRHKEEDKAAEGLGRSEISCAWTSERRLALVRKNRQESEDAFSSVGAAGVGGPHGSMGIALCGRGRTVTDQRAAAKVGRVTPAPRWREGAPDVRGSEECL